MRYVWVTKGRWIRVGLSSVNPVNRSNRSDWAGIKLQSNMLTALDFWHVVEHIIPVYVIVFVGYALTRLNIIQPVHAPGINRWVSIMGVPSYVLYLLAFNDPYAVSLRLVGADVLQKLLVLLLGCLWWKFSKSGSIDGVIDFFMLATLPNTVLIGSALLEPLYGDNIQGKIVTIIFLQSMVWYNTCIVLYELREVLLEMQSPGQQESPLEQEKDRPRSSLVASSTTSLGRLPTPPQNTVIAVIGNDSGNLSSSVSMSAAIERTLSAPARVSFSKVVPLACGRAVSKVDEGAVHQDCEVGRTSGVSSSQHSFYIGLDFSEQGSRAVQEQERQDRLQSVRIGVLDPSAAAFSSEAQKPTRLLYVMKVTVKVLHRIKYAPLTYASVVGFAYSLFAFKFHWTMPYSIKTSIELISNGAVGMAIFLLGMAWAKSGRMISCGLKAMTYGMFCRFLVGPLIMAISSLIFGLRGTTFKFAVLQAVIPQGVISFVLAKEYNLHIDEFSTAVIFQLVVSLPVIIAYYYVLDSV